MSKNEINIRKVELSPIEGKNSKLSKDLNNEIIPTAQETSNMLKSYIQMVRQFEFLDLATEKKLLCLAEDKNEIAIERLIKSHLRLVVKIAFEYKHYNLSLMDLISEGNVGLVTAVRKFDSKKGNRLATYATWWIRAMIQSFILRSWSIVKIASTNAEKKLFFGLQKIKSHLNLNSKSCTEEDMLRIANCAGVNLEELKNTEYRIKSPDVSMENKISADGNISLGDLLESGDCIPEIQFLSKDKRRRIMLYISKALQNLPDREQKIVLLRLAKNLNEKGENLQSIGNRFGISSERVRQIFNRAIEKIKSSISNHRELLSAY